MASQYADIPALNHLAAILIDARRLYTRAIDLAKEPDAASKIQITLGERSALLQDIQARVQQLGGLATAEGSMLGVAHKAFMNVRSVFDRDLKVALEEVERGEKYFRDEVRKAMRREDVSADTRAFLGVTLDRAVTGEMRIEGKVEQVQSEPPAH